MGKRVKKVEHRLYFCENYDKCLDVAAKANQGFDCSRCPAYKKGQKQLDIGTLHGITCLLIEVFRWHMPAPEGGPDQPDMDTVHRPATR